MGIEVPVIIKITLRSRKVGNISVGYITQSKNTATNPIAFLTSVEPFIFPYFA